MHNTQITCEKNNGELSLDSNLSLLLKGIACLIIALHHYSQHVISTGISDNIFYQLLSTQGGYSGVALFFFLSGYGLMESEHQKHADIKKIITGRFWKVYRPVLIINIIQFVVICIGSYYYCFDNTHNFIDVFRFYELDNVFWFVGVLFACYFTFYLCCIIKEKSRRNLMMIVGMLGSLAIPYMLNEAFNHLMSIPFFFVGVWISEYKDVLGSLLRNKWMICLILSVSFGVIVFSIKLHNNILFHISINILQTVLLLIITSCLVITIPRKSKLGKLSFPIYLVHNKILKISNFYSYWPPVLLFIFSTIALGWLYMNLLKVNIIRNYGANK